METIIPVENEIQRLDLLDRQEFVDRMLTIANALSDNRKNACYAVNGNWGVGKSFVLDMFEEQAKEIGVEGEELSRYLVFRYNCWEYDYYDEPLVAMVASMLDQIDEKVDLLPSDLKKRIVAALKVVGKGLVKKAVEVVNEKTGVDLEEAAELLMDGGEAAVKKGKESHEYDEYFDFKKNLKKLKETVSSLAKEQTVIFLVDELDRCLPEYTIKVLERLHHLFNDMPNVQVVLSIDIGQLEHVVKQIYGVDTNTEKYLRKLIGFQLGLDTGKLNNEYRNFFSDYITCFEEVYGLASLDEVNQFVTMILDGIDIRSRISIIEKCHLVHSTFFESIKADFSYLCMEVLLVVLQKYGIDMKTAKQRFRIDSVFTNDKIFNAESSNSLPSGLSLISDYYKENKTVPGGNYYIFYTSDHSYSHVNIDSFWGVILCAYRALLGFEEDQWSSNNYRYNRAALPQRIDAIKSLIAHSKEFWSLLSIIN